MRVTTLKTTDLTTSNVDESTPAEYNYSSPSYTLGQQVKVSFESDGTTPIMPHNIYEVNVAGPVTSYPPDTPSEWDNLGATNTTKMFDGGTTTQTENSTSIEVDLDASDTDTVGLFNLDATEVEFYLITGIELITDGDCSTDSFMKGTGWSYDSGNEEYDCSGAQTANSLLTQTLDLTEDSVYQVVFTVSNYSAGNIAGYVGGTSGTNVSANGTHTQIITASTSDEAGVVADSAFIGSVDDISVQLVAKSETIDLRIIAAADYWEYFFGEYDFKTDVLWTYPIYGNSTLRIKINKTGTAKCGLAVYGRSSDLGLTQYNPTIGILDYSVKSTDNFGNTVLSQGDFAKRADIETDLLYNEVDAINRRLTALRGIPALYDCNNDTSMTTSTFESLIIYGYFDKFDILVPNIGFATCNIRIQGLT